MIGECKPSCVPRRCGCSQVWAHGRTAPVRLLSCSSNFILVCGKTIVFDTAPFCRSRLGEHLNHNEIQQRAKKVHFDKFKCSIYGSIMSRLMVSLCQICSKSTSTPWARLDGMPLQFSQKVRVPGNQKVANQCKSIYIYILLKMEYMLYEVICM